MKRRYLFLIVLVAFLVTAFLQYLSEKNFKPKTKKDLAIYQKSALKWVKKNQELNDLTSRMHKTIQEKAETIVWQHGLALEHVYKARGRVYEWQDLFAKKHGKKQAKKEYADELTLIDGFQDMLEGQLDQTRQAVEATRKANTYVNFNKHWYKMLEATAHLMNKEQLYKVGIRLQKDSAKLRNLGETNITILIEIRKKLGEQIKV